MAYRPKKKAPTVIEPLVHRPMAEWRVSMWKEAAIAVLETVFETKKQQAEALFKVIGITPEISELIPNIPGDSQNAQPIVWIRLGKGYDGFFVGPEDSVYRRIVNYFTEMIF